MLEDPNFIFWLTVFHKIMPHVDILYNQLQLTYTDAVRTKKNVETFIECVEKERQNMDSVKIDVDQLPMPVKRARRDENIHVTRTIAAKEVCDVISNQIKERYSFLTHHSAVSLFDSKKFTHYEKTFPIQLLEETVQVYSFLDKERLKTELSVIYKRKDFQVMNGTVPLLQFVIENGLQTSFSETHKLLTIVSTIPMTTAEAERCFSTLKRIKTFLRSTMGQERLTALAMLSVEKGMIRSIPNFNERVIDVFARQKERRMDFNFKNCT
uniref:HAT C-terminal dimerisation domain-containing protein n=1 Tax=Graphocephala atropunctata TaxID=36148 RepID=A0A1B6LBA9_9HEMI